MSKHICTILVLLLVSLAFVHCDNNDDQQVAKDAVHAAKQAWNDPKVQAKYKDAIDSSKIALKESLQRLEDAKKDFENRLTKIVSATNEQARDEAEKGLDAASERFKKAAAEWKEAKAAAEKAWEAYKNALKHEKEKIESGAESIPEKKNPEDKRPKSDAQELDTSNKNLVLETPTTHFLRNIIILSFLATGVYFGVKYGRERFFYKGYSSVSTNETDHMMTAEPSRSVGLQAYTNYQ